MLLTKKSLNIHCVGWSQTATYELSVWCVLCFLIRAIHPGALPLWANTSLLLNASYRGSKHNLDMFIGAGIKPAPDILFGFFPPTCIFSPPCRKQASASSTNNDCLFPAFDWGRCGLIWNECDIWSVFLIQSQVQQWQRLWLSRKTLFFLWENLKISKKRNKKKESKPTLSNPDKAHLWWDALS